MYLYSFYIICFFYFFAAAVTAVAVADKKVGNKLPHGQ